MHANTPDVHLRVINKTPAKYDVNLMNGCGAMRKRERHTEIHCMYRYRIKKEKSLNVQKNTTENENIAIYSKKLENKTPKML